jgi:hypothetical protein
VNTSYQQRRGGQTWGGYTYYKENNSGNRGVNFLISRPEGNNSRIQYENLEINENSLPGGKSLKNSAGGFP